MKVCGGLGFLMPLDVCWRRMSRFLHRQELARKRHTTRTGADGTVRLWDVALVQEVATFTGHDGPVHCLGFSPDGNTLATASADKTVRLLNAPPLSQVLREPAEAPTVLPEESISLFALEQWGKARAILTSEEKVQRVDVIGADGAIPHAIQLCKVFDDLQEGATYTIRFRAKANAPVAALLVGGMGLAVLGSVKRTGPCLP
jgi:hypothetical protein